MAKSKTTKAKTEKMVVEETSVNLSQLKEENHTLESLKKSELFSHLPESKQEDAYNKVFQKIQPSTSSTAVDDFKK